MADPQVQNQNTTGLQPGETLGQPQTNTTGLQPGESLTPSQNQDTGSWWTNPLPESKESLPFTKTVLGGIKDIGTGFVKGAGQTAATLGKTLQYGVPGVVSGIGPNETVHKLEQASQPTNTAQVVGASLEGIAEFMLGDEALKGLSLADRLGLVKKVAELADESPLLKKIIGHGFQAVRQGAAAAAQQTLHGATPEEAATTGGAAAGIGFGAGLGIEGAGALYRSIEGARPTTLNIAGTEVPVSQPQTVNPSRTTRALSTLASRQGAQGMIDTATQPAAVKATTGNIINSIQDNLGHIRAINGNTEPIPEPQTIKEGAQALYKEAQSTWQKLDQAGQGEIDAWKELVNEGKKKAEEAGGEGNFYGAGKEYTPPPKPKTFSELQDLKRGVQKSMMKNGPTPELLDLQKKVDGEISDFIDRHGESVNSGELAAANHAANLSDRYNWISKNIEGALRGTEGTESTLKQVKTSINVSKLESLPAKYNAMADTSFGKGPTFQELLGPEGMKNYNNVINALKNPIKAGTFGDFWNVAKNFFGKIPASPQWIADKILFDPEVGQKVLQRFNSLVEAGGKALTMQEPTGGKSTSTRFGGIRQRLSELPGEEEGSMEIPGTGKMGNIGKSAPNPITDVVSNYNQSIGKPDVSDRKVDVDPRAEGIAKEYEAMRHNPDDPEVKGAYNALKEETKDQYHALLKAGYRLEPSDEDPYKSYEEMKDDVRRNQRLKVWTGAQPPEDHPLSEVDPETGLSYNTIFRYVHDLMGHVAGDNDFSEAGEENAYQRHAQSYSQDAIPAMTTETKGQTSTFFHGENAPSFPEQKANILPSEFYGSQEEGVINRIKNGKPFAVLQAENPQNKPLTPEENEQRTALLLEDLRNKGYHPIPVGGNTKDVPGVKERAFFVPDITPQDAAKFGKKYGQYGIFTHQGLHDLNTDLVNPIDRTKPLLTGDAARQQQYYTTVGGEDFHAPIDFNQSLKANSPELRAATLPERAKEQLTPEEIQSITKTQGSTDNFVNNLLKIPSVQEYTDIAKLGEGARKWYSRSTSAFKAMTEQAPDYFKPEDQEKFLGVLAATSPQQSVANNLREALSFWKEWNDAGRPDYSIEKWDAFNDAAEKAWKKASTSKAKWSFAPKSPKWKAENLLIKNLTIPNTKVPNVIKALRGEDLWPDLSKNTAFKVPSFTRNLQGWLNNVTNDSWMGLFGGIDKSALSKPESYHPLSVATREAAKALGWEPAEAQAAIWSFTQALKESGERDPEIIRAYSEDFKDLLANDEQTRSILSDLGVNLNELDSKLEAIGEKPEVTTGGSSTTPDSIRKLEERIEAARGRGAIPPPKSAQGNLFGNPVTSKGVASALGGK